MPAARLAIEAEPAVRSCPQCASRESVFLPRYSVAPWHVAQCADCGFVYLQNPPDYSRLAREFAWEKTFVAETARRKAKHPVVYWIDRKTRWRLMFSSRDRASWFRRTFAPGRVLDIGCGAGDSIPEPFVPFGIEVSEALARAANARMSARGGRALHAPAIEGIAGFPPRYFTGVILQSFLEHEKSPKPLLREVARVLADDGAVYVRVPNYGGINRRVMGAKWCGFRHPDHVNYFTLGSLTTMAQACGLRLELLNPLNLWLDDNIKAVLFKS